MKILVLAPQWGLESLPLEDFFIKIKEAGFDGIETWMPETKQEQQKFIHLLNEYNLPVVCHQHQAKGNNINAFCRSFEYYLNLSLECNPVLINSHSGKDYFSIDDQLRVIDTASEFASRNNIQVVHETHRGRLGYSPYNAKQLFDLRPDMTINADFSHWVCVTESYLEHSTAIVNEAILRTGHIHARVGHLQGPQVADPREPEWQEATGIFVNWWSSILKHKQKMGNKLFTVTTEFGPPPYMPYVPALKSAIDVQFEINCFIKNLFKQLIIKEPILT